MKFKEIVIGILIFGFLLGITFIILDYYFLPMYVRKGAVVEVPDITGLELQEAVDSLKKCGLNPYIKAYVAGKKYIVVDTDPPPYMKVKKGRKIGLLVGSGENE